MSQGCEFCQGGICEAQSRILQSIKERSVTDSPLAELSTFLDQDSQNPYDLQRINAEIERIAKRQRDHHKRNLHLISIALRQPSMANHEVQLEPPK
jgi:hypothetical protein